MVKLWSKDKSLPLRELGRVPVWNRLDDFELQIKAEAWMKNFPEIKKIHEDNGLIISFDTNDLVFEAHMSDKQYTMWCIKHQEAWLRSWGK